MFCISCGTQLPDEAAFCSACGRATHHPGPGAAAAPLSAHETEAPAYTPPTTARTWSEAAALPYLYEGRWWSRGPSGEVLVWDDQRGNWDLALSTSTPFFMRRPRFVSLRTPSIWIGVLTGFFLLFTVLSFATGVDQALLADQLKGGDEVADDELRDAEDLWGAMRGLQALTVLGLVPLVLWFSYRMTKNVAALGARETRFTPRWAVGWWFIPVANWFMPYRVLSQAWRSSDPALPPRENTEWRDRPASDFALCAWVALQVANVGWSIILNGWSNPDEFTPEERWGWALASLGSDLGLGLAAVMGIIVTVRLSRRQEAANARFDQHSAQSASPAPGALAQASW